MLSYTRVVAVVAAVAGAVPSRLPHIGRRQCSCWHACRKRTPHLLHILHDSAMTIRMVCPWYCERDVSSREIFVNSVGGLIHFLIAAS